MTNDNNVVPITKNKPSPSLDTNDMFRRIMVMADMVTARTKGEFVKIWAKPESLPICYLFFAYHQNCMVVSSYPEADIIFETYEEDEDPHYIGSKDSVVYLAPFKTDEGPMPWVSK